MPENTLDRVRKLLAQAEDEGTTQAEAEAFTAKAAALMARHGIDRVRLGALHPETDKPGDRKIDVDNPWSRVKTTLLNGIAGAMNCQCVLLDNRSAPGDRVHLFGYESDMERVDILYTSLLLQMTSALNHAQMPYYENKRAWSRSFMLGYISAVTGRVKTAEASARSTAETEDKSSGSTSTALVLANRSLQVKSLVNQTYGKLRSTRATYSGGGYSAGHSEGQRARIGGTGAVTGGQKQLS